MVKLNKKQKKTLEDIFGGDYKKLEDLVGKTFEIISYKTEKVKGYKTPSIQVTIKIEGKTNLYSTFSGVVGKQLAEMKDNDLLPAEDITLRIREGKDSGNDYYSFSGANEDENGEDEEE